MQAARIFEYGQPLRVVQVPEPVIVDPLDVVVRIAGAGVCRTDLHILDGVFKDLFSLSLPFTIGHENAGWVEAVGLAVTHVAPGDPVIVHPQRSCGFCRPCLAGHNMHCLQGSYPGVDGSDGGYAELLRTSARAVVKLAPGTDPGPLAPLADAGVTAYHAVKKIAPAAYPGSTTVVLGVGGLGHLAIQLLKAMTATRVVALDRRPERLDFARSLGADEAFHSALDGGVSAVLDITGGEGADVVIDFVGEHSTPDTVPSLLRVGGTYSIVGYGGTVRRPTLEMVLKELTIVGNLIGSYTDLIELMELSRQGAARVVAQQSPLEDAAEVLRRLDEGDVQGRAILVPPMARRGSAPATANQEVLAGGASA